MNGVSQQGDEAFRPGIDLQCAVRSLKTKVCSGWH